VPEGGAASEISAEFFRRQPDLFLSKWGFDCDIGEELKSYVVKLRKFAKYAQILKNSMA
jgi:hypothetical protein